MLQCVVYLFYHFIPGVIAQKFANKLHAADRRRRARRNRGRTVIYKNIRVPGRPVFRVISYCCAPSELVYVQSCVCVCIYKTNENLNFRVYLICIVAE